MNTLIALGNSYLTDTVYYDFQTFNAVSTLKIGDGITLKSVKAHNLDKSVIQAFVNNKHLGNIHEHDCSLFNDLLNQPQCQSPLT